MKILDTATSASLFVTLLGALLVRQQFALGFRPRIIYQSMRTVRPKTSTNNESWDIWQVKIRNVGQGAATINLSGFILETASTKDHPSLLAFDEITKVLAKNGLVYEEDYWLENITEGFTLPSKEDCTVFEIKAASIDKIKHLEMPLHFQGFLGDKYYRTVVLIPKGFAKS